MFENTIKIHVKGKNIERFIERLYLNNIELLNIKYLNYKEVVLKIYKKDYEKITKIKTIYEVNITELCGINKILFFIKKNIHVFISILISFLILLFLSNVIFKIEIIHSSKELRDLLKTELKTKGIKEKSFVKSYDQIQKIKSEILEEYKDKIEWLEIERSGVKYIVRVEERIITSKNEDNTPRDIIASKDAIIKNIDAIKGEVVKNINDYVKKGDTIVTGQIKLYDNVKDNVKADGKVYGEVWYKVSVEYPLNYYEEQKTGRKKNLYTFTFLNKKIELFNFKPYANTSIEEKLIFKNNWIPFKFSKNLNEEIIIIDEHLTEEEAFDKAILKAKEKINVTLDEKEQIIDVKCLKKEVKDSTIILELFVSVLEDITDYQTIEIGEEDVGRNP